MPERINQARLEELLATSKAEVTKPAGKIARHLYRALLALPELKLSDGSTAKVEAFIPPEVNEDGRMQFSVDVRLAIQGGGEPVGKHLMVVDDQDPNSRCRLHSRCGLHLTPLNARADVARELSLSGAHRLPR